MFLKPHLPLNHKPVHTTEQLTEQVIQLAQNAEYEKDWKAGRLVDLTMPDDDDWAAVAVE